MLFTSYLFLLCFALFLLLYYLLPVKWQTGFLFLAGLLYYAYAGLVSLGLVAVVSIVTFGFAKNRSDPSKWKPHATQKAVDRYVITCVSFLAICLMYLWQSPSVPRFAAIGIMYTGLQAISYIVDVTRNRFEPETDFVRFFLYMTFFPIALQGPVCRFDRLSETLFQPRAFDVENLRRGTWRILFGFFKKLVIADRLRIAVSALSAAPDRYRGGYVLLLMVFYTTQLYADFTGGIDIAIGVSETLGIRLPENFNRPYSAKTLAEFWTRWHITLGTWFRDYVFYPVSTSTSLATVSRMLSPDRRRAGFVRKWLSLRLPVWIPTMLVWFLTGLWHGTGLHFIVWGLLNGLIILVSREFTAWKRSRNKGAWQARGNGSAGKKSGNGSGDHLRVLRTLFIVASLRLLDCYQNVPLAFRQFSTLFTADGFSSVLRGGLFSLGLTASDYVVVFLAVLFVWFISVNGAVTGDAEAAGERGDFRARLLPKPYAAHAVLFGVLLVATLVFGVYGQGYDAGTFLYARF